jgi:hypothetical protein
LSKEAAMQQFKYRITKHPAETFSDLVYYCTESGECTVDQIPHDQTDMLQDILNEEGSDGWELVQVSFGKQGIIAFWKKGLTV